MAATNQCDNQSCLPPVQLNQINCIDTTTSKLMQPAPIKRQKAFTQLDITGFVAASALMKLQEGLSQVNKHDLAMLNLPTHERAREHLQVPEELANSGNMGSLLLQLPMDITRRVLHEAACTSGGNTACFHLNKASAAVGAKFHAAARLVQSTFRGFMIRKLINRASQLLRVDLRTHPIYAEYPGLHGPDLHDHLDSLPPWSDPWGGDQGGAVLVVRILQTEHLRKYLWVFKSLSWLCGPNFGWLDPTNGRSLTPWCFPAQPMLLPLLPQPPRDGPQHHSHYWERWEGEFEASWASWWNGFERGLKNRAWINEARARSTQVNTTGGLSKRDRRGNPIDRLCILTNQRR